MKADAFDYAENMDRKKEMEEELKKREAEREERGEQMRLEALRTVLVTKVSLYIYIERERERRGRSKCA
jgi:hypothetical protein